MAEWQGGRDQGGREDGDMHRGDEEIASRSRKEGG